MVTAWYTEHGYDVIDVDSGHERFNLAASRNTGVRESQLRDVDVVILGDADTIPEAGPLAAAVRAADTDHRVHLPYGSYHSLTARGQRQHETGTPLADCDHADLSALACSGVYVTSASTWWALGGMDERFACWAPEDYAFRLAHETLLGPLVRHEGTVYALPHADQPGKGKGRDYDAAVALYRRYQAAHMDPTAMRTLIAEHKLDGVLR